MLLHLLFEVHTYLIHYELLLHCLMLFSFFCKLTLVEVIVVALAQILVRMVLRADGTSRLISLNGGDLIVPGSEPSVRRLALLFGLASLHHTS